MMSIKYTYREQTLKDYIIKFGVEDGCDRFLNDTFREDGRIQSASTRWFRESEGDDEGEA